MNDMISWVSENLTFKAALNKGRIHVSTSFLLNDQIISAYEQSIFGEGLMPRGIPLPYCNAETLFNFLKQRNNYRVNESGDKLIMLFKIVCENKIETS